MDNLENLTKLEQNDLLGRTLARQGFLEYCIIIDPNPDYDLSWHHREIGWKLEQVFSKVRRREKVRLIIEVPPRHGKSDQVTVKFPTWALGLDPSLEIVTASYSSDLATKFGQKARDIVTSNQYQSIFNTRLREDTTAKGHWLTASIDEKTGKALPAGGGYTSVGVSGPITGTGFNIGIVDDPVKNREEAESEVVRDNTWGWFLSTFYTRQTRGWGAIIIIITRWHEDDIVGRLLEKQEQDEKAGLEYYDKWDIIKFPAIAEEDEKYRKKGEALWPEFYSLDHLKTIENTLGVYEFSALYQQSPISSAKMEFKKEYFKYYEEDNIRRARFKIAITVDPAIGKKKENCDSAIVAKGKLEGEPEWFILDYTFGRLDPGELYKATAKMYHELERNYPNASLDVWIEAVAYQEALIYIFTENMKKDEEYFNVYEFRDTHDKQTRIRGLIPLYKQGLILHRPWMKDLEKQLMSFPKGKKIDIGDALSFHLKLTRPTDRKKIGLPPIRPQPTSRYAGTRSKYDRGISDGEIGWRPNRNSRRPLRPR